VANRTAVAIDTPLSYNPAPQRYRHAMPNVSKLLPIRVITPVLA